MSFFEAVASGLSKYAHFEGRASRAEYWWFVLFVILTSILLNQLVMSFLGVDAASVVSGIFTLAMLLPTIAVAARRLHDMNHSGWWQLLGLTGIGSVVLFIWYLFPGTPTNNRFGAPVVVTQD
jgi:uncharacterized membrane protein YhaH (DUF805 family)